MKKIASEMKVFVVLGMVTLFTCCALGKSLGQRIVLAENKTAKCAIVLADGAIEPEQTAARELADYLKKVTGAEFTIVKEGEEAKKGMRIYVGPTKYAKDHGINCEQLGLESWVMRTVDGNLILAGGRPRGTIYAVYHFLEDIVGVHWWSPWAEHVPSQINLSIAALDQHGKPVFQNRCLNVINCLFGKGKISPFTPRNRINRPMGDRIIPFKYGGGAEFGPPHIAHTEGHFIWWYKKEFDFKRNPEWFAMKNGKRQRFKKFKKNQLCLSNPELRKAFLKKLKENIKITRNRPCPPMIFDVSLNDRPALCECDSCQAIVKKYGNRDSGLLLEFVNYMADGIKDEYPGVMIETLAYQRTQKVPKGIVPRDNVIVTLCDATGIYTKPIPHDKSFAQRLAAWSKITKNLFVWDYHTNFMDSTLPMPFESTFQADLQLFRKYNVTGVMSEYHNPIFEELRDLRLWLLAKLFENPNQNQAALIKTFTDGFYGPAGVYIRKYTEELGKAAKASPGHVNFFSRVGECKYLTLSFILKAQKIFDKAENAVGKSKVLLRRVRHARMAIDKATLALFPKIWARWDADGKKREDLPLNRKKIAARLRNTVEEQWKLRVASSLSESQKKKISIRKAKFLTKIDKYLKFSAEARGVLDSLIPEAKDYKIVYALDPLDSVPTNGGRDVVYMTNKKSKTRGYIDKIAYAVILNNKDYVFVSMDPFTRDLNKIGVPTLASKAVFQQKVKNLFVKSNVKGVENGEFPDGGNIEFWSNNSDPFNGVKIPGASSSKFDFGDRRSGRSSALGHGSMQVHNYKAKQTVFAFNGWSGKNADLGIGNNPNPKGCSDWTLARNVGKYASAKIYIMVKTK